MSRFATFAAIAILSIAIARPAAAQPAGLRIVVLAGEDGANIIPQCVPELRSGSDAGAMRRLELGADAGTFFYTWDTTRRHGTSDAQLFGRIRGPLRIPTVLLEVTRSLRFGIPFLRRVRQ
ncbi:MAG: hypothetical protein A3J29_04745 [Acidobacteria bacterium RIFCSPLOWO2_12_FULL_67_14b]|nr:MAG: hypothetical protein A3J29_04745 [Acidobacteria bacterium RIFCSPLOWO2_12_FULL_67_14b]